MPSKTSTSEPSSQVVAGCEGTGRGVCVSNEFPALLLYCCGFQFGGGGSSGSQSSKSASIDVGCEGGGGRGVGGRFFLSK